MGILRNIRRTCCRFLAKIRSRRSKTNIYDEIDEKVPVQGLVRSLEFDEVTLPIPKDSQSLAILDNTYAEVEEIKTVHFANNDMVFDKTMPLNESYIIEYDIAF